MGWVPGTVNQDVEHSNCEVAMPVSAPQEYFS